MELNRYILAAFCIILCFGTISGQYQNVVKAFGEGNFELSLKLSNEVLEKNAEDPTGLFFRGASLIRFKKYEEGRQALESAKKNNYSPVIAVNANLLRCYAGLQEINLLKSELKAMTKNGFSAVQIFDNEEFDFLSSDKEFLKLKMAVDANANPCKYDDNSKKLDFWLGEWEVFSNDVKVAYSIITKGSGSCTLHEDYQTFRGYTGRSLNYFDPGDSLYTQVWVDKFNGILNFKEVESSNGYLEMMAHTGDKNKTRMSYEYNKNDDTVTQKMESSNDDGVTWSNAFLGIYKRKEK